MKQSTFLSTINKVRFLVLSALVVTTGCELASEFKVPDVDDVGTGGMGGKGSIDDNTADDIDVGSGGKTGADDEDDDDGPVMAVCGNGKLEPGELCDDGNKKSGDGCSSNCLETDDDFICFEEGEPCTRVVTCGNGVIEGDEACDDKNTESDDGCSATCSKVEDGYSCVKPGEPCVELPVCGNGVRERGEQCDDGQEEPESGDGCSDTCQQEDGYFCPPGEACVELDCGDGYRTPDEACDDGDNDNGDGCSSGCAVETGWYCSASGCKPICGDGLIRGNEECDDSDKESGDGCSAACRIEPFWACNNSSGVSVCTSTIECGNGTLEPGEICDPGIAGQADCYSPAENPAQACKAFETILPTPVCGNGVIELEEECDGDNGTGGCDANCQVEDGFTCPKANVCVRIPACGDGFLQAGEQCDAGAMSTMGCTNCQVNNNYFCSGQPSVCVASVCGDGVRAPNEQCDDPRRCVGGANAGTICTSNSNCPGSTCAPQPASGDGCSATCTIETGYICPPNANCLAVCGDGVRMGSEECDSPDTNGCRNCRLQPGYQCGPNGNAATCTQSVCGNGVKEAGEGCDPAPGNTIAGDGCGPTCQIEPTVSGWPNPVVAVTCGDGIKTGSEGCDDGNTTNGDGCSSTCAEENGWVCTEPPTRPGTVSMAVTYRDFKANAETGGHPHFQNVNNDNKGIAGSPCTTGNQATCGRLDNQGKPVKASGSISSVPGPNSTDRFGAWFRDANSLGIDVSVVQSSLPLTQIGGANSDVYEYASANYFPLDGLGFGNYGSSGHNFHFTTELRYFFQYQGGETLTFRGDDDVWVFINGRLAVDVGGVHCAQIGRVILGDTDSSCSLHGADYVTSGGSACATTDNAGNPIPACSLSGGEASSATDSRFGITKGGVYEIVLFHAERHTDQSNFRLTLQGFLAPRSNCNTTCGDGIRAGSEVCDTGNGSPNGGGMPSSGYNTCLYVGANNPSNCTYQFCGDGIKQPSEGCDNGLNIDTYETAAPDECAPGCVLPPRCGDGSLQPAAGEECDLGTSGNTGAYGGCTSQCKFAPYCGDKIVQSGSGETCDPMSGVFGQYGEGVCGYDCKAAPFCGDNVRNGPELCDGSANCNDNCEYDPFCGDGLKTMDEACDYGSFNASPAPYGGCTTGCEFGPRCGDETIQSGAGEECDDGEDNVDGEYDSCNTSCLLGPHCGDGVAQSQFGEACDNGFNEDVYAYPGSTGACGAMCKAVPRCGDGKVQSAYELCDSGSSNNDNAYNGCTTKCEWGPYCGDGKKNGSEDCDNGPKNVAYSKDGKGCSYECKSNVPYCGDGVRNGPEQCDLGKSANTGEYGTCNKDCTRAPYCGDGKKNGDEQCDDGAAGSLSCSPTCKNRDIFK